MAGDLILKVNLWLTLLTIGVACLVLWHWRVVMTLRFDHRLKPTDLLLCGIAVSFLACLGDNVYWGVTWYSRLDHWQNEAQWFESGPYANTLFRHSLKIVAGMCHLEAARRAGAVDRQQLLNGTIAVVVAATVLCFALLC